MSELVRLDDHRSEALSLYRLSTDAATATAAIVKATAKEIKGRRFVSVEGWQAIAIAHGCIASSTDVEQVEGGVRATGLVKRASDGMVLAQAEGFVGEDEPVWYGGGCDSKGQPYSPRPMFAIRAMAQTRAISRACRSAFAHVVVMIDSSLGTTPAEEMEAAVHAPVAPTGSKSRKAIESPNQQPEVRTAEARTIALKRLYGVMEEFSLTVPDDKAETSRRVYRLSEALLGKTITSVKELATNELHDLATAIKEAVWRAYEVLGLDPLAEE